MALLGYFAVGILGKFQPGNFHISLHDAFLRKSTNLSISKDIDTDWSGDTERALSSVIAWSQGDPRKVIYPTDSTGQFCGQAGTPLE